MAPAPSSAADGLALPGDLAARLTAARLDVFGAFHPDADDEAPDGTGTILLLGPHEPGFWAHVRAAPEFLDGRADPMDRWSLRVIADIAKATRTTALFPFGGPPWRPFIRWATRSGRAWTSPVQLLVHDRAGLMVSYRGALALQDRLPLPPAASRPCNTCDGAPCATACPVGALTPAGYDLAACHRFLDGPDGRDCMDNGCAVRRACPVSARYGRLPEQSRFHMKAFHR